MRFCKFYYLPLFPILVMALVFTSACDGGVDKQDQELVGSWHHYVIIKGGENHWEPGTTEFKTDGTGTETVLNMATVETEKREFTWETDDGKVTIIYKDNDEEIDAFYHIDSHELTFAGIDEGITYSEISVRFTGEKGQALVGSWIFATSWEKEEEEHLYYGIKTTNNADGTGSHWEEVEKEPGVYTISEYDFTWSTADNYIIYLSESAIPELGIVRTYSIKDNALTTDVKFEEHTGYRNTEENDTALIGHWKHSSRIWDGVALEARDFEITLNADATGTFREGDDLREVIWHTTDDVLFIQEDMEDALGLGYMMHYLFESGNLEFTFKWIDRDKGTEAEVIDVFEPVK